jgi:alanine-glyoxylate transaminase/(R)-3-amino-2-methylpropionate-pyruvate transaminase
VSKLTNADVTAKYKQYLFPSCATYYEQPVAIESGKGCHVRDYDGNKYLDFFGGILTISVGHANDKVNAAVRAQMERLGHVSTVYPTLPIAELAERLVKLAPAGSKLDKAFFCASGTEADETAIALAQAHTGRQELVVLRHGYSGRSLLAQSVTGHAKYRIIPTQVAGIKHAHAPYCYRCPFNLKYPSCELKCAKDVEELIQTTTMGQVAGAMVEPIMGVGGFITPPEGWMKEFVGIIRKYGGIFIADEVQTGFGRTGGKMWGIEHEGVTPDVMTMAKGIANGYPISAVLATSAIADAWKGGNISTFGGNPISSTAANATIEQIVDGKLADNAAAMGKILRDGLDAMKAKYSVIGDVRGRGLMQGLELVKDEKKGDRTQAVDTTVRLFEETKKRGLIVGRGGLWGNVLRVSPPLIVGKGEIEDALKILDDSFAAITK